MNFNFIEKIPINYAPIIDYDKEITELKKIVTQQSDKINELISIVNILKTSTQSIIHDFLEHLESHPKVTESNSETIDYSELDSEIESDTDTEEYKELVEETYNKIFNEVDEKEVILIDSESDDKVGQKRKRGRPNKQKFVKKTNVELNSNNVLIKIPCPNATYGSKSYIVSNYTTKKIYNSKNEKYLILELSNNKKYCFGKDFALKFYKNYLGLTNIIRRILTHVEDYLYVKVNSDEFNNRVRVLLTKSGLLKCIDKIKYNKVEKTQEQIKLLKEYSEFANELD